MRRRHEREAWIPGAGRSGAAPCVVFATVLWLAAAASLATEPLVAERITEANFALRGVGGMDAIGGIDDWARDQKASQHHQERSHADSVLRCDGVVGGWGPDN